MRNKWPFYFYLFFGFVALLGTADLLRKGAVFQAGLWVYLTGAGVLILGYGLVRDLLLLLIDKSKGRQQQIRMTCLCLESNVGLLLVFGGLGLYFLPQAPPFSLPEGVVLIGAAILLALAHATRDWVVVLMKVPDHRSILPTWKNRKK